MCHSMKLAPHESLLKGAWITVGNRTEACEVCKRIQALTESWLLKRATDVSGWHVLYSDPQDGRLWELSYPEGGTHGGGPPQLQVVDRDEAVRRYGPSVLDIPRDT